MRGFQRWLLPARSAVDLAVLRIAVCAWLFLHTFVFDVPRLVGPLPAAMWSPPLLALWLPEPPPQLLVEGLFLALRGACLAGLIGLWSRVALPLAALTGLFCYAVAAGFGVMGNQLGPLLCCATVLAFGGSGDALAWDARGRPFPPPGPRYGWPLRTVQLLLPGFMLSAGIHKLCGSWLPDPGVPLRWFLEFKLHVDGPAKGLLLPGLVAWLAASPGLCSLAGWGTLGAELGAPLLLGPWRGPRWAWLGMLFAMQVAIAVLTYTFVTLPWLPLYVAWIPWSRGGRR